MDEEKKDLPVVGADGVQEPVDPEAEQRKAEQEEREKKQKQKQDRSRRTVRGGRRVSHLSGGADDPRLDQTDARRMERDGDCGAGGIGGVHRGGCADDRAHRTLVQAGHGRKEEPYDGRGELKWIRQ